MRTQRKKYSRLWVYLLYLGLVTSLILSVTLARYVSTAGGTGTATVAAMAGSASLTETLEMPLEGLLPGGTKTLTFQVVNYSGDQISEVALLYDITVRSTGNLPLTFALTAGTLPEGAAEGESAVRIGEGDILDRKLTGGAFPLTERKRAHSYTLTVTWPEGEDDAGYADEIDLVTITIEGRQRLAGEGESTGT